MHINVNIISNRLLLAYVSIMPFIYVVQVILGRADIVIIPYIFLMLAATAYVVTIFKSSLQSIKNSFSWFDITVMFYAFMLLTWSLFEFVFYGFASGIRLFCIIFVPVSTYFLMSKSADKSTIRKIVSIISFTSTIVSIELLTEIFSTQVLKLPSPFQILNYNYVLTVSGKELNQLWGINYRPPGILEHIHVTAIFIAIGVVACIISYLLKKSTLSLLMFAFNFGVLFLSGGRLALMGCLLVLAFVFFHLLNSLEYKKQIRKLLGYFLVLTIATVVLFLVYFSEVFFNFLEQYYTSVITTGTFMPAGDEMGFWSDLVPHELSRLYAALVQYPIALCFGFGPTSLLGGLEAISDDFFIGQIIGQFGLVGGLIFYSFFVISITAALNKIKVLKGEDKLYVLFALSVLILLLITTFHSAAINRKAISYLLFLVMGIIRKNNLSSVVTHKVSFSVSNHHAYLSQSIPCK